MGAPGPKVNIQLNFFVQESHPLISFRVMLVIQVNKVHQVAQVQWVTWVHQVQHFQVNVVKRVFQVQLVSTLYYFSTFSMDILFNRYSGSTRCPRFERRTRYDRKFFKEQQYELFFCHV